MYKLLIVDDEEKARKLIRESISWDALSISQVIESKDGLDAINKIEEFKPDMMILDIKMPKMDGIELLRILNEKGYNIKTIVSSGYNDFEYAKESYNMGIIDYILKPIQEDQLVEIISKCINIIEDENEQKNGLKVLNDNLIYYKQRLEEQVIFDYLLGNECMAEDEALNEIDKGIEKAAVAVLVCNSDKVNINDIKDKLLEFNLIKQCYLNNDHMILFFVLEKDKTDNIKEKAVGISKKIINCFWDSFISIGIGRAYSSIEDLNLSYNEAMFAIGNKVIYPKETFFDIENLLGFGKKVDKVDYTKELVCYIKDGDEGGIRKVVEHILKDYYYNQTEIDIDLFKISLLSIIDGVMYALDLRENENVSLTNGIFSIFNNKQSINNLYNGILEILFKLAEFFNNNYIDNKRNIVTLAKEYIKEHFFNKISLSEVSKAIFITPSYLSKIFYEIEGLHFSDYIKHMRIEKAKELLEKKKNYRIYQISEAIGYRDPKHFIKVFKNIEGETPSEYRNRFLFSNILS